MQMQPLLGGLLGAAGAVCILAGLLMLLRGLRRVSPPPKALAWLYVDLNQPHFIERLVYRHHRKTGVAVILAAALWLWLLSPWMAWKEFFALIWQYLDQLWNSAFLPLLAGSWLALAALVIGLLLLVRPSLLKPLEVKANRWIHLFPQHPRKHAKYQPLDITAWILMTGGAICLWGAIHMLRG